MTKPVHHQATDESLAQAVDWANEGHEWADGWATGLRRGPGRGRTTTCAEDRRREKYPETPLPRPHGRSRTLHSVVPRFDRVIRTFENHPAHCDACSS